MTLIVSSICLRVTLETVLGSLNFSTKAGLPSGSVGDQTEAGAGRRASRGLSSPPMSIVGSASWAKAGRVADEQTTKRAPAETPRSK